MQHLLLEMLDQRAADLVRDAFGLAGGPGGIEDVQRIIETARNEFNRQRFDRYQLCPVDRICEFARTGKFNLDHLLDTRYLRANGFDFFVQRMLLAVVKVAVGGEQKSRFGLTETVDHAVDAEIGRG